MQPTSLTTYSLNPEAFCLLMPILSRLTPVRLAFILLAIVGLAACQNGAGESRESIRIGMESTAVNSLIFIAEDQKYFDANKLDVTFVEYPSGLAAVEGMINGEVDLATASEFVIVGKALSHESIQTIATIDKFLHNYLIGRKDLGISTLADLPGKRIGLPLKTAAEFYLGRFLDLNGMNIRQVTLVDVSPPDIMTALTNGEVDAVLAWQPNAKKLEDLLGDGIVRWPAQSEQVTYCSIIGAQAWIDSHSEAVERFLKSLADAQDYLNRRPEDGRAIIQKRLKYDDAYLAAIWPEHNLQLSLDQSLILALEDESRWMIANGLTTETQVPDFLDYISTGALHEVKPEAVNIIR
ncbi:MAG: hypothetical protein EHM70_09480 [Chloroflexota bacterium]|nr:MAG: hypothetical protein EHM70_09480 [Chloroflexota bacterium]